MARRRRGPISKAIKRLCSDLFHNRIDERQFKAELRAIIQTHGATGYVLQGIGMALDKWSQGFGDAFKEKVWGLADEVDPRIRDLFEKWKQRMSG